MGILAALWIALAAVGVWPQTIATDPPVAQTSADTRAASCAQISSATWRSTFADGTFGEWSASDVPGNGGGLTVTTPGRAGIAPSLPCTGGRIAEFRVTAASLRRGDVHAKVYKGWDVGPGPGRRDDGDRPLSRLVPGEEGGVYSAWYYIPRSYKIARGPVNIFQFKEDTSNDGGITLGRSDMQSSVSIFSARGFRGLASRTGVVQRPLGRQTRIKDSTPVLGVDVWHPARPRHARGMVPAPLGRWFNVTAVVRPRDRVAYYVDGSLLDVWTDREYPVGIRYPNAMGWTFGVGHYGGNVGRLWVAGVSVTLRAR
ncbi:hypothetical protein [Conexibacter woesei]|uniref:Uncharacterized protein n=1 Tax=Conexibacter woesei (strain DSM 14684 / CCUG 47730 / CIP 108061 / JCM 11494 / NBRC 100937 / ID131577) TaxID=469383 RepID=D3FFC2_CONWI|nr:hypothetical protein [Conexibacter woesei]ADB53715.1 hypothetical protein Cwoe_5309 [Conexibacter woesei DSM 14684]